MKVLRGLAQYYVDLMMKLGLVRFSLLLAAALVVLAMIMQMAVTIVLRGQVDSLDMVGSIFFGLIITPLAVYFLSVVVEQLEESRQRLSRMVDKLEVMRKRDSELNTQLQGNIEQLNQEIIEREKAERAHLELLEQLKQEMKYREQTQIELEQQSTLLRSFLDASPDLVYYRNENNEFSGCNRAMELLTGKSEKQLVGLTPLDIYDVEIASKVLETDEKVFRHNVSLTYEQWLVYPDGRKACFELRKVPFYDRVGKRHGLMGFGRDITERKRYQEALENASRDKTTFISTISHELRTPLNGIVGLSRILLDTELTNEQTSYLKTIHVSAITLGNIFNDVIEMDKIERRKVQIDNQPVILSEFISDLENLSGLLVQPKGLKFVMDAKVDLPAKILTDGTRLRQILWNLIGNAVKFTQQGEVKLRIWSEKNDQLFFSVQDSGIGIPKDELDKIFAMYYQVTDSAGGRPATGTGIGLAVSRRLAQNMGGDIQVNSEIGKGSTFTLSINAPVIEEEICDTEESEEDYPLPALHILLVEDIELNVVVARSVLENLGNTVDVAMNGKDALSMFAPGEYDLILLDIQLPDMTGMDIARQLNAQYSKDDLPPLIALTANVLKDKKEYFDAGMDGVLSKPLAVPALTQMIEQFWGENVHEHVQKEAHVVDDINESVLDCDMLEQYLELVGPNLIYNGLDVFEKMIPGYLAILDSNMIAKDQKGIVEEAHKIKGAAGSIGLKNIQKIAQQIQSPDLPAWWDNVQEWVDELKQDWKSDIETLRNYVDGRTKK
ncbi:aerobic respiration two-component sensor histidine kinase ArcB [Providencia sneebia]|uniref:Aerobic respiration control sensor protein n=1 Tax=Providencia sneebia DSM 19967 TaxID=1141660 RepID=K8WHE1_9GAMM|nr:aerobic respiration two-component sensor histidine kinase ArcB [Providencia sneebia]EKT59993.1 aerobic respiration control sensor protein ArcB [Providencia sneebia DSM 19967]